MVPTSKEIISYLLKNLKPFSLSLLIMIGGAIIWSVDLALRPYLLKIILNNVTSSNASTVFEAVFWPVALYLGMYLFMITSNRVCDYFVEIKMIPRLRSHITQNALEQLVNKDHSFYQNTFSGSLANKVNDLTNSMPDVIQIIIDSFFSHSLALVCAMITLWQVSYLFSVFMMTWTFLFIGVAFLLSRKLIHLSSEFSECRSAITGKLVDTLSNILSVRLFTGKDKEKQSLQTTLHRAIKAEEKLEWSYLWMWFFYGYSFFLLTFVNFYLLIKGRQEGWITVGDFALVLVINISIVNSLWQVAKDFSQFSKHWGRVSQGLQAVLQKPALQDHPQATTLSVSQGRIVFDKVSFHYKGTKPLFHELSVTIEPGQKVGLVGSSGGGKTTFVNLILRLYDVSAGRILIDGQDIRQVTQDSLHAPIAMIPQDPSLFHRTLYENIGYGTSSPTPEKVIQAAQQAHAHDFILKLSHGYDSYVGDRGVKLSGGQRQRIAIARAILKNAPILILDEATSQLDSVTENYIQDSLWALMQGKTTLVVAHRLSTLLHMDRILVFNKGHIVEDGPHHQLLAQGGLYKTLWDAQMGGFLPNRVRRQ